MATTVPIQKILVGFSFMKSKAAKPTQTGARFASNVEILAFDNIMEEFHVAISKAKSTPQIMAIFTPCLSVIGFLKYNQIGIINIVPKNNR